MFEIAIMEFRTILRNRLVAACAIIIPLGVGTLIVLTQERLPLPASAAGLVVIFMQAMGIYVASTTALAGRRQTLYLKRLRTTRASGTAILAGLLAPVILLSLAQIAAILIAFIVTGESPGQPWTLAIGVVASTVLFLALAIATAAGTTSPEHAQITTLPLFMVACGAALWITFTGLSELEALKLALPGGAAFELVATGWSSAAPDLSRAALLFGINAAWVAVAIGIARIAFRWEPRK